MNLRTNSQHLC